MSDLKLLMERFSQFADSKINEQEGTNDIVLKLPKFRISEQWGTPGSADRKIIEMFTNKIKGSTLTEKINSLNSFVGDCDETCASQKDVAEILANLVFLDSLASVIYDFNDKTGGFLFESILAALFGGKATQIATKGGKDQDVTDLVDDRGRPLSLKFFFSDASQYIGASYQNLAKSIIAAGEPMIYIIAVKNRISKSDNNVLSIDFYEFSVGVDEDPGPYVRPKIGIKGDYDAKDLGKKKYTRLNSGYGLPIRVGTAQKHHIGTLNMGGSRDHIKEVAQNYADRLGSVLFEIYNQIDSLSSNVNTYFLESPEAKAAALKARENAVMLKKETDELI